MKKTLIALAAAATLAIGFSATAKADPSFGFGFAMDGGGRPHIGFAVAESGMDRTVHSHAPGSRW